MQTQVENKFFEDFRKESHSINHSKMDKWRTKIIHIAKHTQDHMKYLDEKEKSTLRSMRLKDIANMKKKISDNIMLDALQLEQEKRWPRLGSLDQSIDLDIIFPQHVLNFSEYQQKL